MPRKQELHFNTPEQVEGYLRMALAAVEAVNPPEDLRVTAYEKAVDLIANKHVVVEQLGVVPDLSGVRH